VTLAVQQPDGRGPDISVTVAEGQSAVLEAHSACAKEAKDMNALYCVQHVLLMIYAQAPSLAFRLATDADGSAVRAFDMVGDPALAGLAPPESVRRFCRVEAEGRRRGRDGRDEGGEGGEADDGGERDPAAAAAACSRALRRSLGLYVPARASGSARREVLLWTPFFLSEAARRDLAGGGGRKRPHSRGADEGASSDRAPGPLLARAPDLEGDAPYRGCEFSDCFNTYDRSRAREAAAVWFNCAELRRSERNRDQDDVEAAARSFARRRAAARTVPTDEVPTDDVPTDEVPTDEVPTDKVPTDKVPTDDPTADDPTSDDPPAWGHRAGGLPDAAARAAARRARQRWIFYCTESPLFLAHAPRSAPVPREARAAGYFDWRMTYARDAEVPTPLAAPAALRSLLNGADAPRRLPLPQKTRMVAWLVSNCATPSRREAFAEELAKHVQVDVFGSGACLGGDGNGRLDLRGRGQRAWRAHGAMLDAPSSVPGCEGDSRRGGGQGAAPDSCVGRVLQTYRFYLAFENAVCEDYITEKLWVNALQNSAVPVVLDALNYEGLESANARDANAGISDRAGLSDAGISDRAGPEPGPMLLRASDFSSAEALAARLRALAADEDAYRAYFRWREVPARELPPRSRLATLARRTETSWCSLCRRLHEDRGERGEGLPPLEAWWGPGQCAPGQEDCCWV
jgi:glycoprotein 3-alpha-L-fucosyltransferase